MSMAKNTEYEIKVLNVDTNKLREKLLSLDFTEVPRFIFKRRVYDLSDGGWIRLRTNGTKTTLTYKKSHSDSIDGVEEIETEVSDFESTNSILEKAGIIPKNYQENYRTEFSNGEIEVTIDEWPKVDPYVEIEGSSVEVVKKYLSDLGLGSHDTTSKPTSYIYELAGINLNEITDLRF